MVVPDGVIVVDKPPGMTSHDVVARILQRCGGRKRRGKGAKVGHAGTLDPDATGVLVVCLGRATRLVPYLQASAKTYEARVRLGVATTTLDAGGTVTATSDPSGIDERAVCEALQGFVGPITQIPPMVSAVRVGGERLHVKARRGEDVERPARDVTVHDIVLEDFSPGAHAAVSFLVTCSAGTYVRTLAADLGMRLGVGAHLATLRRIASGRFTVAEAAPLADVETALDDGKLDTVLLTPAEALADFPRVLVDRDGAVDLGHGRALPPTGYDGPVAALDADGRLLAVLTDRDGAAHPIVVLAPTSDGAGVR